MKIVRKLICRILPFACLVLGPLTLYAQISIDPIAPVCAGEVISLTANVNGVYGTESYTFEQYPYSPEPWDGGTEVILDDDEIFPDNEIGLEIGFPFCFLNSSVTHFWIGSNGWISFLPNQPTTYLPTSLPNPAAPKSAIFAPWQDWNPEVGPQANEGYIFYRREGTAPNRKLIVTWKDCPMYNCNSLLGRFQIVIHETTNIIDNHIASKPECNWQSNTATQGIQNATGTAPVYIAFGRNQNSWTVLPGQEESTHFVPSGITWHEGSPTGPVIGTGDHITVTATVSTTYWAVLAACDNTGNYEASVAVTVYPLPAPTFLSGDITACQNDIKTYTTQPGNSMYEWIATGGTIVQGGGNTDAWADIQWGTAGAQSVTVNYKSPEGCMAPVPALMSITVNAFESPVITTPGEEFCPGEAVTYSCQAGKTNYVWDTTGSGATWVAGGTLTDNFITLSWTTPGAKTITVNYTDAGCTADPPVAKTITIKPAPSVNGPPVTQICSGSPTAINLSSVPPGADFSWNNPPPLCSANIAVCPPGSGTGTQINDVLTLADLNPGSVVYTVKASLDGCTGEPEELQVQVSPQPDVLASPPSLAICSGETAIIAFSSSIVSAPASFSWNIPTLPPGCTVTATSGTGDIHETITNNTFAPIVVIFEVTPTVNGCSASIPTPVAVTVKPIPDVLATPPGPTQVCSGGSVNISFSSNISYTPVAYSWSVPALPPGLGVSSASGTATITESFTNTNPDPGTVSFQIIPVAGGCTPSSPSIYNVVVNPLPVVMITGPQVACVNTPGPVYQTQPGQSGYIWNVTGGTYVPGAGPEVISVTWSTAGTGFVTAGYTNSYGCSPANPATYPVEIVNLPEPSVVAGPTQVCTGITSVFETQQGMSDYQWSVVPDGTLLGGDTYSITVTWNTPGVKTIAVNYQAGPGCTGAVPGMRNVTVSQSTVPVITSAVNPVCQGSQASYTTQPGMSGYTWMVSAGGTFTSPVSGNSVTVRWDQPGNGLVSVNFTNPDLCTAPDPTVYPVTIHPLPDVTITTPSPPYCQGSANPYYFSVPADPASQFTWTLIPSAGSTAVPGAASSELYITFNLPGSTVITVSGTGTLTGCSAVSAPISVNASAAPEVALTACFDAVTTLNAKSFPLKGGSPASPGGIYTIDHPAGIPVTVFNPATSGTGLHTIYYTYTNAGGCSATGQQSIRVLPSNAGLPCTGSHTDPRDNSAYAVVQIGTQCWMQENLRFGSATNSLQEPMADNCLPERYCLPGDPVCSEYGSLYQWQELMQYSLADRPQGLCPPGWHIPNEAEWQVLINNVSAGSGSGTAGSFLKDAYSPGSFTAIPAGFSYLNHPVSLGGTVRGTFFWTSTTSNAGQSVVVRGLNSEIPSVSRYESAPANAFPVRCIKD